MKEYTVFVAVYGVSKVALPFSYIPFFKYFLLATTLSELLCCLCLFLQILKINPQKKDIESFVAADFELIGYNPHQKIEMKMSV